MRSFLTRFPKSLIGTGRLDIQERRRLRIEIVINPGRIILPVEKFERRDRDRHQNEDRNDRPNDLKNRIVCRAGGSSESNMRNWHTSCSIFPTGFVIRNFEKDGRIVQMQIPCLPLDMLGAASILSRH